MNAKTTTKRNIAPQNSTSQKIKTEKLKINPKSLLLSTIYKALFKKFGPQGWWPGDTPLEIAIGAILTQQTTWKNVEKAIASLKKAKALSAKAIWDLPDKEVEALIRSAGYFRQKTKKLKIFCQHLLRYYDGKIEALVEKPLEEARKELLHLWGIGDETADSILCYAGNRKTFVIDAYTKRIFSRLKILTTDSYEKLKRFCEEKLPQDLYVYQEFHALLVALGKDFCKPRPKCDKCPLSKACRA